jgi:hypothetical protein
MDRPYVKPIKRIETPKSKMWGIGIGLTPGGWNNDVINNTGYWSSFNLENGILPHGAISLQLVSKLIMHYNSNESSEIPGSAFTNDQQQQQQPNLNPNIPVPPLNTYNITSSDEQNALLYNLNNINIINNNNNNNVNNNTNSNRDTIESLLINSVSQLNLNNSQPQQQVQQNVQQQNIQQPNQQQNTQQPNQQNVQQSNEQNVQQPNQQSTSNNQIQSRIADRIAKYPDKDMAQKTTFDVVIRRVFKGNSTIGIIFYIYYDGIPETFDKYLMSLFKKKQKKSKDDDKKRKYTGVLLEDFFGQCSESSLKHYMACYLKQKYYGTPEYKSQVDDILLNRKDYLPSQIFTVETAHEMFDLPDLDNDTNSFGYYYNRPDSHLLLYEFLLSRPFPWCNTKYPLFDEVTTGNNMDDRNFVYSINSRNKHKRLKIDTDCPKLEDIDPVANAMAQEKMQLLITEFNELNENIDFGKKEDVEKFMNCKKHLYKCAMGYVKRIFFDPTVIKRLSSGLLPIIKMYKDPNKFKNRVKLHDLYYEDLSVNQNVDMYLSDQFASIFTMSPIENIPIKIFKLLPINFMLSIIDKWIHMIMGEPGNTKSHLIKMLIAILKQIILPNSGGQSKLADYAVGNGDRAQLRIIDEILPIHYRPASKLSSDDVSAQAGFKSSITSSSNTRSYLDPRHENEMGEIERKKKNVITNCSASYVIAGNTIAQESGIVSRADISYIPHILEEEYCVRTSIFVDKIRKGLHEFNKSKTRFISFMEFLTMVQGTFSIFYDIVGIRPPSVIQSRYMNTLISGYKTFGIENTKARPTTKVDVVASCYAFWREFVQDYCVPGGLYYECDFSLNHLPTLFERSVVDTECCICAFMEESKEFISKETTEVLRVIKEYVLRAPAKSNFENNVDMMNWVVENFKIRQTNNKNPFVWIDSKDKIDIRVNLNYFCITTNKKMSNLIEIIHANSNPTIAPEVIRKILNSLKKRSIKPRRRIVTIPYKQMEKTHIEYEMEGNKKKVDDFFYLEQINEDVRDKGIDPRPANQGNTMYLKIPRELFINDDTSVPKQIVKSTIVEKSPIKKFLVANFNYGYQNRYENTCWTLLDCSDTKNKSFNLLPLDAANKNGSKYRKDCFQVNSHKNRILNKWLENTIEPVDFDLDDIIYQIHAQELGIEVDKLITRKKAWELYKKAKTNTNV